MESTIIFENIEFNIEYDFYPSEPMVLNYGDGNGYPGSSAEVDLHSIKISEFEVYDVLDFKVVDKLYDLIIDLHEQ